MNTFSSSWLDRMLRLTSAGLCVLACTSAFTCVTTFVPEPGQVLYQPVGDPHSSMFPALKREYAGVTVIVDSWTVADLDFTLRIRNDAPQDVLLDLPGMYAIDQRGRRLKPVSCQEIDRSWSLITLSMTEPRRIPAGSETGDIMIGFDPRPRSGSLFARWFEYGWRVSKATLHLDLVWESSGERVPFAVSFRRRG